MQQIHTSCFLCGHRCRLDISRIKGFRGVGLQGAGRDVGSKFARGGISVAAVTVVCFDLTMDKMEAERAELIAIILNVAKLCIIYSVASRKSKASIDASIFH